MTTVDLAGALAACLDLERYASLAAELGELEPLAELRGELQLLGLALATALAMREQS